MPPTWTVEAADYPHLHPEFDLNTVRRWDRVPGAEIQPFPPIGEYCVCQLPTPVPYSGCVIYKSKVGRDEEAQ